MDNDDHVAQEPKPTMEQALTSVVTDNMDAIQAGIFSDEMKRLKAIEIANLQLESKYSSLLESKQKLESELHEMSDSIAALDEREKELHKREEDMDKQITELHIKTQLIELQLDNANLRVTDHQSMFNVLCRNTEFRKNFFTSETKVVHTPANINDQGQTGYIETTTDNNSTNVTETTSES